MNTNKLFLFFFCICLSIASFSQEVMRDPVTHSITNLNQALSPSISPTYDVGNNNLSTASKDSLSYEKIKGSPFWNERPLQALLYFDSKFVTTVPVRINLATDEIHFTRDTAELVMDNNIINKIVFKTTNDSFVFISNLPNFLTKHKPAHAFVQVLNFGKYQLLKYTKRKISAIQVSTAFAKNYYFIDNNSYFMMHNNLVENVRKLTKENLLLFLPSSSDFEEWINENKINFKEEADIVRFLNYYNAGIKN
jgi:hypothetical protein